VKRIHLLPVAVLLSGALAGCAQGTNANTTIQDETGNGIVIEVGGMTVASATVVAGDEGADRGAISAVVVNGSGEEETLEAVVVDGATAELTPGPVAIEPGASVQISSVGEVQAEFDLDAPAGEFVDAQFVFSASGIGAERVLVVPPVGYYEQYAPGGTTGESGAEEDAEAAEDGADGAASDAEAPDGEEEPASE
jgi:hypothetical protein